MAISVREIFFSSRELGGNVNWSVVRSKKKVNVVKSCQIFMLFKIFLLIGIVDYIAIIVNISVNYTSNTLVTYSMKIHFM